MEWQTNISVIKRVVYNWRRQIWNDVIEVNALTVFTHELWRVGVIRCRGSNNGNRRYTFPFILIYNWSDSGKKASKAISTPINHKRFGVSRYSIGRLSNANDSPYFSFGFIFNCFLCHDSKSFPSIVQCVHRAHGVTISQLHKTHEHRSFRHTSINASCEWGWSKSRISFPFLLLCTVLGNIVVTTDSIIIMCGW